MEHSLITAADVVAPLTDVFPSTRSKKCQVPQNIKRMLNRRKNILKIERNQNNGHHVAEIKALNKIIKNFYTSKRRSRVRNAATGTSGSIWRAVGLAKDLNSDAIPSDLTLDGVKVEPTDVAGAFARHFSQKVNSNVSKARVNAGGVYNGKCKLIVQNRNFMSLNDVKICLDELNNKKCEGFDRIPVCMLSDMKHSSVELN